MDDMNCRACLYWLQAYIDSEELDEEIAAKLHEHLDGCPKCRERLAALEVLRKGVRERLPYHPAPSDMHRQVLAEIATEERRALARKAESRSNWTRLSFAAVVLALLAILYVAASSSGDDLADEFISRHQYALLEDHLIDLPSSDPATLVAWFAGKLDFSPPVRDFDRDGYRLVGGRLDYIEHRPVAALVYRHEDHIINVFAMPATRTDRGVRSSTRHGFNLVSWRRGPLTFEAVSTLNKSDLQALRRLFE